jgi:hypothetical protein
MRLDHVLDAVTSSGWRSRAEGRPLTDLLGPLTACSPTPAAPPALVPDGPASFLLVRTHAATPTEAALRSQERAWEAEELELEAVFIDGRRPAGGR